MSKKPRQAAEAEKPVPGCKNQDSVVLVTARKFLVMFHENVHRERQKDRKVYDIYEINHFPGLRPNPILARPPPETKPRVPVEVASDPDNAVHGKEAVNDSKMIVRDGIDFDKGCHDEGNSRDVLRSVRILNSFPAVAPVDQSRRLTWSSRQDGLPQGFRPLWCAGTAREFDFTGFSPLIFRLNNRNI